MANNSQTHQTAAGDYQYLDKMQALQEVSLTLYRTTSLEELYRQAVELGRSRLGFDRLGLLLYDEANSLMHGAFGTDEQGNLRDERDYSEPIEDPRLLQVLHSEERIGYWPETQLRDFGQVIGQGWNAMAVLWSGDKAIGWLAADNLIKREPLTYHLDILKLYGATLGHLISQKQSEEALHRQERARYQMLFDNAADAIVILDNKGNLNDCNHGFIQLLGYGRDEVIGQNITRYFEPASLPLFQTMFPQLLTKGHAEGEVQFLHKNGNAVDVWNKAQLWRNDQGEFQGVVLYSRDITARKNSDRELNLRQSALEATVDGVVITDKLGNILWVNQAFSTLTQYSREEAIGGNPRLLKSGVHDETFYRKLWQTLLDGRVWRGEIINRRKDGSVYPEDMTITPVKSTNNEISHYIAVKRDISQRKATEDRQRQESALLTSLLNSVPDLIFYKDVAGVYLGCNAAFAQFTGREAADIVGKTDFDIFPHEVAAFFRVQDTEMMAQGEARHNEEWVDYPDGRHVLLDTLKTPFYDADKNLLGLIGLSRDITATYQAQEELRRLGYVVEQSLDGTAVADLDGIIQFVNPAWAAMHGYTVDELIGQHLSVFHTPDQLANEVDPVNQRALASGQAQRAEIGHVRKDGVTFPTLMTIDLLRDENAQPIGLVAATQDITDRKEAERALQENQERLEEATRIARLHYWEFDVATQMFTFLPAYYELLGTTAEEEGGYTMSAADYARKYVPDYEASIVEREILNALTSDDPNYSREIDSLNLTKDGRVFPIRVRFRLIRDQKGNIIKFVGANQDITEQVKTEQALRENQARLTEAARIARLHYWEFDVATQIFTFLPTYYELLGTTAEDEGGYTMSAEHYAQNFVPDYEAAIVSSEIGAALASEDPNYSREFDSLNRTKDGRVFPIRVRFRLIRDEEGQIIKFVGANQDITEQVKTEQALRERESLLRTIINSTPDWVFVKDVNHRYLLANQGYGQSLHRNPDDFIGKDDLELGFPEEIVKGDPDKGIPGFWADDDEIMKTGQVKIIDVEPAVVDGQQRFLNTTKAPLKDSAGQVIGIVGFVHDITERIAAEETLAKQAAQLQTVAEISTSVSTILDQPTLLRNIVDLTKERFNLYHSHIYLLDPSGKSLVLVAGAGEVGQIMTAEGRSIPLAQERSLVARAARSKQSIIINDIQSEPGFLPHPLLPGTKSEMAVPMLAGDQVIGVLDIQADQTNYFTEDDANIQTTLATQIAIAVENARLLTETQRAFEELDALTRRLTRESWENYLQTFERPEWGFAYNYGQLLALDPASAEMSSASVASEKQANGLLAQPLLVNGESIGRLALFNEDEEIGQTAVEVAEMEEIIAAVAEQLSSRIENLRLTDQTQAALSESSSLYEASAEMNAAQTYDDILAVVRKFTIAGTAQSVSFSIFDRPWTASQTPDWIELLAVYTKRENQQVIRRYPLAEFPSADTILKANKPTIIEDFDHPTMPIDESIINLYTKQFGARSAIFVPLVVGGQWIGYINALYREPSRFLESDIRRLTVLASQSAISIQNVISVAETKTRADELGVLNEMSRALATMLDPREIIESIHGYVSQLLDADNFFIALYDAQANELNYPVAMEEGKPVQIRTRPFGNGLTEHVIQRGRAVLIEKDLESYVKEQGLTLLGDPTHSWLGTPMISGRQIIGVIGVLHPDSYRYNENHLNLLSAVASQTTIALQNARLFQQTQTRAQREQMLREITARVRSSADMDTIMKTAVKEIGQALGRRTFIYLGGESDQTTPSPAENKKGARDE